MKENNESPFTNGHWEWDNALESLVFSSHYVDEVASGAPRPADPQLSKKDNIGHIRFKEAIDVLGMAQFRRLFQRRIKPGAPIVVTIQDVKDVAIFTAEKQDLTVELISFLHTSKMDQFLRSLIVYFQYYMQVWESLIMRREEAKRKLWQPIVTVKENVVRNDLADLRSMVARNYAYILMGLDDSFRFYHMSNKNRVSLSDKDRYLHECLLGIAARIVWIALLRKNFNLIEIELNRIFRTETFNLVGRLKHCSATNTQHGEKRILLGAAFKFEKKLKHRSPTIQELIFDNHDYEMLGIGQSGVKPIDQRVSYLEIAYSAPEDLLSKLKVSIGILGLDRRILNSILQPKEGMAKRICILPLTIPIKEKIKKMVGDTMSSQSLFPETKETIQTRKHQCLLWRKYVLNVIKQNRPSIVIGSASISADISRSEDNAQ